MKYIRFFKPFHFKKKNPKSVAVYTLRVCPNSNFQFTSDSPLIIATTNYNSREFQRADPTDRALSRKMRNLTKLTNLLIADIKTSIATYQDLFRETLNVDYVELACKEYEKHLGPLAKNIVTTGMYYYNCKFTKKSIF